MVQSRRRPRPRWGSRWAKRVIAAGLSPTTAQPAYICPRTSLLLLLCVVQAAPAAATPAGGASGKKAANTVLGKGLTVRAGAAC